MDAIYGGHYWGLGWKYTGLLHDHHDSSQKLSEVVEILDMWSFIESGYAALSLQDKARLERKVEPPKFRGFDGNNEAEYIGISYFLVDKLERFSTFEGRDLNARMPTLEMHRRMLRVFESTRRSLMGRELTADELVRILNEMTHPENQRKKVAAPTSP
jgi:uncharacterized protein YfbU (UPF0304 family)